jgi:hypothetical protein
VVKSGARAASTVATGGLATPVLSLAEDLIAGAMVVLAVLVPILAAALVAVVAVFAVRRLRARRV